MTKADEISAGEMDSPAGVSTSPCLFTAFEAVREASASERERVMARHCGDDVAMRAQLEQLLADCELVDDAPLAVGARLEGGRYELSRPLGQGGFGSVWLAYDHKLERAVALKVLRGGTSRREQLALGEARAASAVVSDHVRRVLDVDRDPETGSHYIVMELCREEDRGGSRDARSLRETKPRNRSELVRWCRDVALGVHAVHQQGLFHGDIKPDNVMILPVSRRAQVIDFGAAGRVERERDGQGQPAGRGLFGTPAYMAPELASGQVARRAQIGEADDHQVLVRLDTYAVGALLYEGLAGAAPYLPQADAADPVLDVLAQVRAGPPPALAGRARKRHRGLRFFVPARLGRIVARAMARSPALRYPTCQALADDLCAFLAGGATSVDRPFDRVSVALRRHRWALLLSGLAIVVLLQWGYADGLRRQTQLVMAEANRMVAERAASFARRRQALERQARKSAQRLQSAAESALSALQTRAERQAEAATSARSRPTRRLAVGAAGDVPAADESSAPPDLASLAGMLLDDPSASADFNPPEPATARGDSVARADGAFGARDGGELARPGGGSGAPGRAPTDRTRVEALIRRYVATVRRAGPHEVIETRGPRRRLTHIWVKSLSEEPVSALALSDAQRALLERVLRNRARRRVHLADRHGRVQQECGAARMAGSRVNAGRLSCDPARPRGHRPYGFRIDRFVGAR